MGMCMPSISKHESISHIPTWEKDNHRLKSDFFEDMLVPRRVYIDIQCHVIM